MGGRIRVKINIETERVERAEKNVRIIWSKKEKNLERKKSYFLACQRVLNDLQRTGLFGGRMIRLLAHPLLTSPVSRFLAFSVFLSVAGRAYLRERGE